MSIFRMIFMAAICCGVSFSANSAGMYQWKDKNGVITYSDRAPEGVPYKQREKPGRAWDYENNGDAKEASKPGTKVPEAKDHKKAGDDVAEKEENCKAAKSAKATLLSGKRISVMDDKGELVYLDEAQVSKKLEYAEKAVKSWCGEEQK